MLDIDKYNEEVAAEKADSARIIAVKKQVEAPPKSPERKELQEYLAKAVKDYGLEIGKTSGLCDEFRNKLVIVESRYAEQLRAALQTDGAPGVHVFVTDGAADPNWLRLEDVLAHVPATDPQATVEPTDLLMIIFTAMNLA